MHLNTFRQPNVSTQMFFYQEVAAEVKPLEIFLFASSAVVYRAITVKWVSYT